MNEPISAPIPTAALEQLRARHAKWLEDKLFGPGAEAAFRVSVAAGLDALLDAKVGDVLPAPAIHGALERIVTAPAFDAVVQPITRVVTAAVIAQLAAEPGPVSAHVPEDGRAALDRVLGKKGLAPTQLIREVCAHDAANELMRDTLAEALAEFQSKLNPFGFVKKLPFGFGVGKTLEAFKTEFDKTLEPEIRKFLQGFSRRALSRLADTTIEKWDDAPFVALRRSLATWVLARPLADASHALPGDAIEDIETLVITIVRRALTDPANAPRRRALADAALGPIAGVRVRDALAFVGVVPVVDAVAVADLTWPAARAAFASPGVRAWFTSLVDDFYAAELQPSPDRGPA